MSTVTVNGSNLGNSLQALLMCDEIVPGSAPSYQTCKVIYELHPHGAKMAEAPITLAQSVSRKIILKAGPAEDLRRAFNTEWEEIGADKHIFNTKKLSRIYGIASVGILEKGGSTASPLNFAKLAGKSIAINVWDPLNTAGSLVLNQDPNALDFQKYTDISVAGQLYHRSRTCTVLNGEPIYIGYTSSAFGFVGRSVYQRALFPMKSFIQTLRTDDMVVRKAGLLVAMMKGAGSIIDNIMAAVAGIKRSLLKEGETDNVISIDEDEKIETLNMQNLEKPYELARKNILKNEATAADMPAVILENETLTEGFGEGTEDAKTIATYAKGFQKELKPLYDYFDKLVQFRAWNVEFFLMMQEKYPELRDRDYESCFYEWTNNFSTEWPSLLIEPESEQIKVEETKYKAVAAMLELLLPQVDPKINRPTLIQWACDILNENKKLFPTPLLLDLDALAAYTPPVAAVEPDAGKPFSRSDADDDVSASDRRLRLMQR